MIKSFVAPSKVVFDLDGTLADTTHRDFMLPPVNRKYSWEDYALECLYDTPIPTSVKLLEVCYEAGHEIWIVSGRHDVAEALTRQWLRKYVPNVKYKLRLRPKGIKSKNVALKEEWLRENLPVELWVDDHPDVINMVQSYGVIGLLVPRNALGSRVAKDEE